MTDEALNPFAAPRADLEGAPALLAGQQRLAERGVRFVAALLDTLLFVPAVAIAVALGAAGKAPDAALVVFILWSLALGIIQVVLLATSGQTLGKRWTKIRVVRIDGAPAGFAWAVMVRGVVNTIIVSVP